MRVEDPPRIIAEQAFAYLQPRRGVGGEPATEKIQLLYFFEQPRSFFSSTSFSSSSLYVKWWAAVSLAMSVSKSSHLSMNSRKHHRDRL